MERPRIRIIFGNNATPENQSGVLEKLDALKQEGYEVETYGGGPYDTDPVPPPVMHLLDTQGQATRLTFGQEAVEKQLGELLNPGSQNNSVNAT